MTSAQVAWLAIIISILVIVGQAAEMFVTLRDPSYRQLFWPWNRKHRKRGKR